MWRLGPKFRFVWDFFIPWIMVILMQFIKRFLLRVPTALVHAYFLRKNFFSKKKSEKSWDFEVPVKISPRLGIFFRMNYHFSKAVFYVLSFEHSGYVGASVVFEKIWFFQKNLTKLVIWKTLKRDYSRITESISILNTVFECSLHKLSFESIFGAKFKISKSRNLIGRKFLKFFFENFFLNIIKI